MLEHCGSARFFSTEHFQISRAGRKLENQGIRAAII